MDAGFLRRTCPSATGQTLRDWSSLASLRRPPTLPPTALPSRLGSTETASPCSSGNTMREWPRVLLILPEAADPDVAVQPYRRKSLPLCDFPRPLPLYHAADIYINFSQPIGEGP